MLVHQRVTNDGLPPSTTGQAHALLLVAPRLVAVKGRTAGALSAAAAAPGTRMAGKAALWGLVLGLAASSGCGGK